MSLQSPHNTHTLLSSEPDETESSLPYGEKTRRQFQEKLTCAVTLFTGVAVYHVSALCRTFLESSREELILPTDLGKEELMCVEQLCEEMGLVVHKGDKVCVSSCSAGVSVFNCIILVVPVCCEGYQADRYRRQQLAATVKSS